MNDPKNLGPEYRLAYMVWWAQQQIAEIERKAFERTYHREKPKKKETNDAPNPEIF